MKHIKDNIREVGKRKTVAWKTDNQNIVKRTWTHEEEIHLDKLEKNIKHLLKEIKKAEPIPYPPNMTETMKRAIDTANVDSGRHVPSLQEKLDAYKAIWEQCTEKPWQ